MRGAADPQTVAARRALRKRKYIQSSKTTKNYTLAVSRLPDDVLEDIFVRCGPHPVDLLRSWKARRGVRNEENGSCFSYEKPWMSYGNLIRFSHVCQRWRRIIRMTGAFWSYRAICSRSNMPTSLIKSLVHDAPFVVDLVLGSMEILQPWVRDPKTIARTSILQAVVSTSRSKQFSELIKANPASALKSLTVASTRNGDHFEQDVGLGRVGDSTLFADAAPLLRNVCLISVKIPSDSTILRNLTSLCLCNTDVIGEPKDNENTKLGRILGVISRCPGLESLVLDKSLPSVNDNPSDTKRILLSSLNHISILGGFRGPYSSNGRAGYCLMSCLDLPSLSRLHVGHGPPVAMSVEELVPENVRIIVGDANALIIKLYENNTSRGVENLEIRFGVVSDECLSNRDEFPSRHFSTTSSVMYTVDHNESYYESWSDMAAMIHSFIHRCLGNRRTSILSLTLELGTRLHSRYRRHKSLHLEKLFDSLTELKVIEVRCEPTTPANPHSESREGSHSSKVPPVISDIEADDGRCEAYVAVWALGAEVTEALHSAVVHAEERTTYVAEGENGDIVANAEDGNSGRVVLPHLTRLSFVGAYFNTTANYSTLNKKKSWRTGQTFEHLVEYVEHRARNSLRTTNGIDESRIPPSTSTASFTFAIPTASPSTAQSEVDPQSVSRSPLSFHFSGCFGIHDEWLEKLSSRCGATILSPHALRTTRLHAGVLEWDIRDPWFMPHSAPEDDEERKREIPDKSPSESEGADNNAPPVTTDTETPGGDAERAENVPLNAVEGVSYGIQALDLAT